MSLTDYDTPQNTNTSIQIHDEQEPFPNNSIFQGLPWLSLPQSGASNSMFTERLKNAAKGRDPINAEQWATVTDNARARLKGILEDVCALIVKENGEIVEEYFLLQPRIIPLGSYTMWADSLAPVAPGEKTRKVKRGGRQMNRFDTVKRQAVLETACQSYDGLAPNVNFVGLNPFTNQVNMPYHTGLGKNVEVGPNCDTCPFNNWALYGGKPPQCGQRHVYLAWMPAQTDIFGNVAPDRIVLISGSYSVQAALNGPKAGDKYAFGTRQMLNFEKLADRSGSSTVLVPVDETLSNIDQPRLVVGFANGAGPNGKKKIEHFDGEGFVDVKAGTFTTREEIRAYAEGIVAAGQIDSVTHLAVEQEKYVYAPDGLDKDIYPIEMVSVINNHPEDDRKARIPLLSVKNDEGQFIFPPLSAKMKARFLEAKNRFLELRDNWKTQMVVNAEQVKQKLAVPQISISEGPAVEIEAEIPSDD